MAGYAEGEVHAWTSIMAGASSGVVGGTKRVPPLSRSIFIANMTSHYIPGAPLLLLALFAAIFGNPLFLVKARMQAYSPFNPVGAQHNYPSVFAAFRTIVQAEGPKGLARGMDAAMLRTAMGSSVQLPAYNLAKSYLSEWGVSDGVGQFLMASLFSGLCVCAVMQPAGEYECLARVWGISSHEGGATQTRP